MSIYEALSHPAREKILLILGDGGPLTYGELMNNIGIKETGKFNYHLKKMAAFLSKEGGLYTLNSAGLKIYEAVKITDDLLKGKSLSMKKPFLPALANRVAVIFCSHGGELDSILDMDKLTRNFSTFEGVNFVKVFYRLCSPENTDKLVEWCRKNFINFVVIAACSPEIHKEIFSTLQKTLEVPVEVINIIEQCAWVHPNDRKKATDKVKVMIEAKVETASMKKSLSSRTIDVKKSVAVVGGGISGLTVAQFLTRAGFSVYLIEELPVLGGKVARWGQIYGIGDCASCLIAEEISRVALEPKIKIFTNTEISEISGGIGDLTIILNQKPKFIDTKKCNVCGACLKICPYTKSDQYEYGLGKRSIIYRPYATAYPPTPTIDDVDIENCKSCRKCEDVCNFKAIDLNAKTEATLINVGAIVFAVGAEIPNENMLKEVGYNLGDNIISSAEFERMLAADGPTMGRILCSNGKTPKQIGIIQCVNQKFCSTFCCDVSKKYLQLVKDNLDAEVHIFFKKKIHTNMPSREYDYIENIHFMENIALSKKNNGVYVSTDMGDYNLDLAILNIGMVPSHYLNKLHKMIEFTLDEKGFIQPSSLPSGMFACGTCTGPKGYKAAIAESKAVALEVMTLLSKDKLLVEEAKVQIDIGKCGFCGLCSIVCNFRAITVDKGKNLIYLDSFKCKGCGACVPICPTNAIEFIESDAEIIANIRALSNYNVTPKILVFCCSSCGYAAADNAAMKRIKYTPNSLILKIPCAGRVSTEFILEAFNSGFDGIIVAGCRENSCRYGDGINKANRKIRILKKMLEKNIEEKVKVKSFSAIEGAEFAKTLNEFYNELAGRI